MMRHNANFILIIAFFLGFANISQARIIRVPQEAATISAGVAAASNRDTVLIADGEYTGANNRNIRLTRTMTVMSENGPADCIINAQQAQNTFGFETFNNCVIAGLTIRGCTDHAIKALSDRGFVIRNCVISNNRNGEQDVGCGIRFQSSTGRVEKCIIRDNLSGIAGGGMTIISNSNATIWNSIFLNNESNGYGGAIAVTQNSDVTIGNCIIRNNEAMTHGGGIALSDSSSNEAFIYNCNVLDNTANAWGGGLFRGPQSSAEIIDCVFWGNDADVGTQLGGWGNGSIDISYCVVQFGPDLEGGWGGNPIIEEPAQFNRDGRNPEWGFNGYYLDEDSPCIDAGSRTAAEAHMDTMTTRADRDTDEDEVDIGFHYDLNDFTPIGTLSGYVYDVVDNRALSDAIVSTSFGQETYSSRIGFWSLPQAIAGEFDITASRQGYNDSTITGVVLEEDGEMEINFHLLHPVIASDVNELTCQVDLDDTASVDFTLSNTGNGNLEYSIERKLTDDANFEPWDLRSWMPIGLELDDNRLQGAVFANGLFYVAGGSRDTNQVYRYTEEGVLVDSFPQYSTSLYGYRDMTWDGELIWAADERTIYGITPDGILDRSFEGPYNPSANLAWDPDRGVLWISGTTTNIAGYDRDGNDVIENRLPRFRLTGLAYFEEEPDGQPLYMIHRDTDYDYRFIIKMNPDTGDTTLVNYMVLDAGEPQGAQITGDIDPYSMVFITIINTAPNDGGDQLTVYQLASNISWMQVNPAEGIVPVDESRDVTVTVYAEGFVEGEYHGLIVVNHNAAGGVLELPLTMRVVDPDAVSPDNQTEMPFQFAINSIYPNPFNAALSIDYAIDRSSEIELSIIDLTGRSIHEIAKGYHQAGSYQVSFDAAHRPSGLYLVRFESENAVKLAKIVCVK